MLKVDPSTLLAERFARRFGEFGIRLEIALGVNHDIDRSVYVSIFLGIPFLQFKNQSIHFSDCA